jgi:hypothetical protein
MPVATSSRELTPTLLAHLIAHHLLDRAETERSVLACQAVIHCRFDRVDKIE